MLTALASAFLLGLSAGLAPGPLMTLVVAQSLRHGPREGCKIAAAPLITDAPIILLTLAWVTRAAEHRQGLGMLSFAGGAFVLYLALDAFRPARTADETRDTPPQSWLKGVLTNLLNPHPWLFWTTIGATTLARSMATSWLAAGVFLGVFYLLLVGSKVLLALLVGRSRHLLTGRPYRLVMQSLGVLLVGFAVLLFREGWRYLN